MPVTMKRGGKAITYLTVAERIAVLHDLHDQVNIETDIIKDTNDEIITKTTVTIPGKGVFTGLAHEVRDTRPNSRTVNATSYCEVCETSSIGRALAAAGLVGGEYASADELAQALRQQGQDATASDTSQAKAKPQTKAPPKPAPQPPINKAQRTVVWDAITEVTKAAEVVQYVHNHYGKAKVGKARGEALHQYYHDHYTDELLAYKDKGKSIVTVTELLDFMTDVPDKAINPLSTRDWTVAEVTAMFNDLEIPMPVLQPEANHEN